jgi:fatty-acyl-CoA synthase
VVARPHPKWDERPVAVLMLEGGGSASDTLTKRVVAHCATVFAKYELPDDVLVWEELPLTGTGKLDKKVVRARLDAEGYTLPSLRTTKSRL